MIIPNLPFGYKTRDWWAKAIKQIAESAASILPSRTSEDAGKVLKVNSSGGLEWGEDAGLPPGGNNGDVLTKAVTGPAWFPPVEELPPIFDSDVGKVLKISEDEIPVWADDAGGISQAEADARYLQLAGGVMSGAIESEEGGALRLVSSPDGVNSAELELFRSEESGYTDEPSIYAGITSDAEGYASMSMATRQRGVSGPSIVFDIEDGNGGKHAPEVSEPPTIWNGNSLTTLDKVLELLSGASPTRTAKNSTIYGNTVIATEVN